MDISIQAILHLFFRLAPFILVCFFTLYSIFNKNVKGIIYLAGLLLTCFFTVLVGNIDIFQHTEKNGFPATSNNACRMIEFSETGPISYLPLGQTVLAYTLFYVGFPIIMTDFTNGTFNTQNVTTLAFFILLIGADLIWNVSRNCFSLVSLLTSSTIGVAGGLAWGYTIQQSGSNLQLFRSNTTSKTCDTNDKKVNRCRPRQTRYIYPINMATNRVGGMCHSPDGSLYICEADNHIVRKVKFRVDTSTTGTSGAYIESSSIVAGTLEINSTDAVPSKKSLNTPLGICMDSDGNLYVADSGNHLIRKIDTKGNMTTIAGTLDISGNPHPGYSGDGKSATSAQLNTPTGICVDKLQNIYFTDAGNNIVRKIDNQGIITCYAGIAPGRNSQQSGSLATSQVLTQPSSIAVNDNGTVYVLSNNIVYEINMIDRTIGAVTGTVLNPDTTSGTTNVTVGLFIKNNTLYQIQNYTGCIDVISSSVNYFYFYKTDGNILYYDDKNSVYKSTYFMCFNTGVNTSIYGKTFLNPRGACMDSQGNLYVADSGNHVIRKITPNNEITTYAGTVGIHTPIDLSTNPSIQTVTNYKKNITENVLATTTTLNNPTDVCIDGAGNLYVADCSNNVIRKIDTRGYITTYAGINDNNTLNAPKHICVSSDGIVHVIQRLLNKADCLIHKIDKDGSTNTDVINILDSINFIEGYTTQDKKITTNNTEALTVDINDNMYCANVINGNPYILKIDSNRKVSKVILDNININKINGLYVDKELNIYIMDDRKINKFIYSPIKKNYSLAHPTIAGAGSNWNTIHQPSSNVELANPTSLCIYGNNMYVTESDNNAVSKMYMSKNTNTV